MQLIDESIVSESESLPAPLRGRQAGRQFLESNFSAIPDLHIEIELIITSGDYVVTRSHLTGTHKGTFLGIPADFNSCHVVEVRNGKVVHSRAYPQTAKLLQQVGVLTLPKAAAAKS